MSKTYIESYNAAAEKHGPFSQMRQRTIRLPGRKYKCWMGVKNGIKFFEPRWPDKKPHKPYSFMGGLR